MRRMSKPAPASKHSLSIDRVRELLDYDPESGEFKWKPRPAGHRRASGYVSITIDGIEVKAHQLAWFITHGEWPKTMIDHINGNTSDNRIANLRDATHKINAQNRRKAAASSRSRLLGVTWHKQRNKWMADIYHDGRKKYLGLFETQEEAHNAYLEAKRLLHPGNTI